MPDCLPSAVGAQIWGAGPLAGALSAARGQERGKGPALSLPWKTWTSANAPEPSQQPRSRRGTG